MPQRKFVTLTAFGVALIGLMPLSPAVAGRARPHHHGVRVGKTLRYPKTWPKGIPVRVGDATHYPMLTTYLKGPEYWRTLPASTRARLTTFGKLQLYCQQHEGTWPLP